MASCENVNENSDSRKGSKFLDHRSKKLGHQNLKKRKFTEEYCDRPTVIKSYGYEAGHQIFLII